MGRTASNPKAASKRGKKPKLTDAVAFDPRWRTDILGFFRDVLDFEPWGWQREVALAVQDGDRVSVRSGHRVGKSFLVAAIALWFYCCWPDARVLLTAPTSRQLDLILWRTIRVMHALAKAPIEGQIGKLARTGLRQHDEQRRDEGVVENREIVGFTGSTAEAVQGVAGPHMLFIVDEASGVDQHIFDALEGNRAGGAKILLLGNPTKNEGEFYDAFGKKQRTAKNPKGYVTFTVPSTATPNCTGVGDPIEGLADPEWVADRAREWGADSAIYKVRVLGVHAENEAGRIFSRELVQAATARWEATSSAARLWLGCDPAGASGLGDESAFATRRGARAEDLYSRRGMDIGAHVGELLALMSRLRVHPNEQPVVVIDALGPIGHELGGRLRREIDAHEQRTKAPPFVLVEVRSSDRAVRGGAYETQRDELAASLEAWMRAGGAIPPNAQLQRELLALEWKQVQSGAVKLTPKDELRKLLGASPDLYDALSLACWEPLWLRAESTSGASSLPSVAQAARREQASSEYEGDDDDGASSPWDNRPNPWGG